MKNIIVLIIYSFLFLACEKENKFSSKDVRSGKVLIDTVRTENKNVVIFIAPTSIYIDSLKNSYNNKDDFYTIADDANFYTAEAGNYIREQNVDTINITNQMVLKIGKKVIDGSKYKPWTLLLYKKEGSEIKNIYPIDIEKYFPNYYSKNSPSSNESLDDFLNNRKYNSSNILFENKFDSNSGSQDYILILNKDDNIRTLIVIKKAGNSYSLSFANDNAIPCEQCGNGAQSFYDYEVKKDSLLFSSSYKSNEDIFKIDFKFKNNNGNSFFLDEVILSRSIIGASTENRVTLDKTTFGLLALQNFNYTDFISEYILR